MQSGDYIGWTNDQDCSPIARNISEGYKVYIATPVTNIGGNTQLTDLPFPAVFAVAVEIDRREYTV